MVINRFNILGVNISQLTVPMLHAQLLDYVQRRQKALVLHANVHCLNLAYDRPWLRQLLNRADIVFCDGAGVLLGAWLLRYPLEQRITYADWMWQLAQYAEMHHLSMFFLGASPTVAEKAMFKLQQRHPQLQIVGCHDGYFDKRRDHPENRAVLDQINQLKPDILVLGLGMPLQEQWLADNWADVEAYVALTGGAVFDYISGELQRAPRWMTDNGLEWLGRLLIEPKRLWRRYIIGNPLFLYRILQQRLGRLPYPIEST